MVMHVSSAPIQGAPAPAAARPLAPAQLGEPAAAFPALEMEPAAEGDLLAPELAALVEAQLPADAEPVPQAEPTAEEQPEVLAEQGEAPEQEAQAAERQFSERWLQGMLDQRAAVVEARPLQQPQRPATGPLAALDARLCRAEALSAAAAPADAGITRGGADGVLLPVERVAAAQSSAQFGAQLAAGDGGNLGSLSSQPGQTAAADAALKLQSPQAKWGEQMLNALRQSVELQVQQRVQNASIRLDPPELGRLDISVSHEAGRLNVQISAAHSDVARLLHQTSERLRQELMNEHFVQVEVQVRSDGQPGRQDNGQPRQQFAFAEAPVAVNLNNDNSGATGAGNGWQRDVLVTV